MANGDGGEFAHYLRGPSGKWTQVTQFSDQITYASLGPDRHLYLLSRKETPRGKIVRVPLEDPKLGRAEIVVGEGRASVESFQPSVGRLYVVVVDGGPSGVLVYDLEGRGQSPVNILPVSSVWQVLWTEGDEVLFQNESFITPSAWYRYDPTIGKSTRTGLFVTSPADFSDCEVVKEFVVSRDGTWVPLNVVRRKGTGLMGGTRHF